MLCLLEEVLPVTDAKSFPVPHADPIHQTTRTSSRSARPEALWAGYQAEGGLAWKESITSITARRKCGT
jgi:hypothetical protein